MREIIVDTETTGLNPHEGHRIVEIGAIEIIHQSATGKIFHKLINPEREVPEDAVRVHGHTASSLSSMPIFAMVVDEFLNFLGDACLVMHNAEFDIHFINSELGRLGRDPIGMDRVVDTLAIARRKHPGNPNSLDALCDRYRIDRTRRVKHGALLDAEILVEVYGELTGGRQRSLAFENLENTRRPIVIIEAPSTQRRLAREIRICADEATAHADHVLALGDRAIWLRYRNTTPSEQ